MASNGFSLSYAAEKDIEQIIDYIAQQNPMAASNFYDIFYKKFKLLAEHPRIGVNRAEIRSDIRSIVTGNYVIFYEVNNNGVEIARVIDSARDIDENYF